jgi:MFS family permease
MKNNLRSTILRYYIFVFLQGFVLFSAVLVPFFTEWGGLTLFQVQLIQSWFMLWSFLLEVPTGTVADYLGRKHSIAIGALFAAFAMFLYGTIPSFINFLIAEFILALGFALVSGADKALIYDSLKDAGRENDAKKIFGKTHSIMLISMGIAAPIGSLIAQDFGLNTPILLTAIPFLIAAIIAWGIKEPKKHDKTRESRRYFKIAKDGFFYFYTHRSLRILAIDAILVSSATYFIFWYYQPLLQSVQFPIFYFGVMQMMMIASEIIVASNFVFFEKIFGSAKTYIRFSALITAAAFFLVATFTNIWTIVIFIIFAGGFGVTRLELMTAHMQKFIPSEKRATVLSSVSMFRRFTLIFINPLIGLIATQSLHTSLFVVGLLPLAVFFFSPIEQEMFE